MDEPEIYLHPDVQRQLLGILRTAGPDIILATHSTEIMSEADPSEILLVEKTNRTARRLHDIEDVQAALAAVGSIQNITLTQLARNRRVLFVEGLDDFVILRRFAQRVGFIELSAGIDLTPVESGGFSSWERIRGLAWGIERTLGQSLRIGAVFDRDYWSTEELSAIQADLDGALDLAHIHSRKEIENYLLVPAALERACRTLLKERAARSGEPVPELEDVRQILDRITIADRNRLQSQYIARRTQFLQGQRRDSASVTAETIEFFEAKWRDLDARMEIVAGKDVLAQFRTEIQSRYGISLTDHRIISEIRTDEIPPDLFELLNHLETFRKTT